MAPVPPVQVHLGHHAGVVGGPERRHAADELVTHHMSLADAPAAYELYDRREALKIVLEP